MRDALPDHYEHREKLAELWDRAVFVFDTNALVDAYRLSASAREHFFQLLERLQPRLWLPFQAASEFFGARLSETKQDIKAYEDAIRHAKGLLPKLTRRSRPLLNASTMATAQQSINAVEAELRAGLERVTKRVSSDPTSSDPIVRRLLALFERHSGTRPPENLARERLAAAKERMRQKVPPGYMDDGAGDALLWLETLDYAKATGTDVILVTGDMKEDWWTSECGRTTGPREEMIREFRAHTGRDAWIYKSRRFISLASDRVGHPISTNVVREISEGFFTVGGDARYEHLSSDLNNTEAAYLVRDEDVDTSHYASLLSLLATCPPYHFEPSEIDRLDGQSVKGWLTVGTDGSTTGSWVLQVGSMRHLRAQLASRQDLRDAQIQTVRIHETRADLILRKPSGLAQTVRFELDEGRAYELAKAEGLAT